MIKVEKAISIERTVTKGKTPKKTKPKQNKNKNKQNKTKPKQNKTKQTKKKN